MALEASLNVKPIAVAGGRDGGARPPLCVLCVPCGSNIRAGVVLDVQYRDAGDNDEEKCHECCGEHCAFTAALKDELGEDARRADAAENADDAEGSGGA